MHCDNTLYYNAENTHGIHIINVKILQGSVTIIVMVVIKYNIFKLNEKFPI